MKDIKVWLREAFYIRKDSLDLETQNLLRKQFSFYFFEEKACEQCEEKIFRRNEKTGKVCERCQECAAFLGGAELSKSLVIGNHKYLSVPSGSGRILAKILKQKYHPILKSLAKDNPIKPIEFCGKLRDYQEEACQAIYKKKRGVICLAPRSGKTLIGVAAICRIQQKTMILASQREWLLGFQETFLGSATQQGFTKLDKERIGFCKTYEDFKKYDICLVTVQSLHSERGQILLKKIRSMFGCVVIDEVHGGAAPKYIQVLSQINCKYKIGLSGTPDRKDGKYVLVEHVVGPVIFETKVKQLVPQVLLTRTNFSKASSSTGIWAYIVGPLEKDKNRQKLIAKIALEDIKKGHMILIPYSGVKAILSQVEIINKMAGKEVAKAFYGSVKKKERDKIIEDARNYKLPIIVGNIKLLSTGINIPRASEIIDSSIQANIPNARQRFARILTPWEDKPQPVIRLLLDDYNVKRSCLRMEFWQALMPYFHPKISEIDYNILKKYFSNKKDFEITLGRYD